MSRARRTATPEAPAPEPRRSASAFLAPALAALVPLAAYLATLHPGLPAGDSGELITVAATGGIAHPPGYPLYALLAGAWRLAVPWGTVAWRLGLLSAVTMAGAAAWLAIAVARAGASRAAGVVAAWAFALSLPAWKMSVVAEVFALNALLAAAALWMAAEMARGRPAPAAGLVFLCALSLSHHHTLLLLAVPLLAAALLARGPGGAPGAGMLARTAAGALLGLLPLHALLAASARPAALRWGDASTFRGLASLLMRAEYGTLRLDPSDSGLHADRSHLAIFGSALPDSLGVLPLLLALAGAAWAWRRARLLAWSLAGYAMLQAWFFTRVGFPSGSAWLRGVVERFYVLPLLVLCFLAGLGAAWLLARFRGGGRRLAVAALAALVLLPAAWRAGTADQRGNRFAETLGRGVLASLPHGAVVFVQGDLLHNALEYLTRVERLRPDVTVVDQELLTYGWYVRQLRERDPALLPPLGRAQRILLRDGRTLDGLAIRRGDGTVDVLEERGQSTRAAADVVRADEVPAAGLFPASRAHFRTGWPLEATDDRYSGLPGSRNLVWFDQLLPRRPVAVTGTRDESYTLRDELTPVGFVSWVRPRGESPSVREQAEATLALLDTVALAPYFRRYDPTSFEQAERWRFSAVAARAALLASQPEAAQALAAHAVGHARLLAFAARFEALEPSPDPACLRAIGFLRGFDPAFRDLGAARRDLERYVASGVPAVAGDREAREALERLRTAPP